MTQQRPSLPERGWPAHDADGWASTTANLDAVCKRCGARIGAGETVVASGYSEDPITWICRRHSNIEAERPDA